MASSALPFLFPPIHDLLSTMLFDRDYVQRLIEIGQHDSEAQTEQIAEFLN